MNDGKVIAYTSIQLKIHEKNYPTHNLKLVAVVFVFGDTTAMVYMLMYLLTIKFFNTFLRKGNWTFVSEDG